MFSLMTNYIMKLKNFFLQILFPKNCVYCNTENTFICDDCLKKIKINKFPLCPVCKKLNFQKSPCLSCRKQTKIKVLFSPCLYQDPKIKELIHIFKYNFIENLTNPLSYLMIKTLENEKENLKNFVIIPVPLHKKRLRQRGFNQAELLANEIGKFFQISVLNNVLKRIEFEIPQTKIENRKQRKENIKNAFQYIGFESIKNKNVLLIDDVATTGATLNECAKILKQNGAKIIWAATIAR